MVEHGKRPLDVHLQRRRQPLGLRLLLDPQRVVQVPQHRHPLRGRVGQVVLVHHPGAAVYHRLFNGLQALPARQDELAQGEEEVAFQRQRGLPILAGNEFQVHRVEVVGAVQGDAHHLGPQALHQADVLRLHVQHQDVVGGGEEHVGDLPLGAEGLAGARGAQHNPVGALEAFAIAEYHVAADGVQPVVDGVPARLERLTDVEGHEHPHAGGGEPPLDFHPVHPQGQGGHEALLLLIVQAAQLAVVLLHHALGGEHVVFQLLPGGGGMHQKDGGEKHFLVLFLEGRQQLLGLLPEGHKVRGEHVVVIAGPGRPLLLVDFGAVQIGELALDELHRLPLVDGVDVDGEDEVAVQL